MIGVIGGTGIALEGEPIAIETPYGPPSGALLRVWLGGAEAVALQRHGAGHTVPPHRINYRANLWALRETGVRTVLALGAVGNLRPEWEVGDLVLCDQFVNRTHGRADTFFEGPEVRHAVVSEPYCASARAGLADAAEQVGLTVRPDGVLLIIQGPRYSTRAENRDWRRCGYDVISMTHYPEVVLARELGLCFVSACVITDHASVLGDARSPAGSDGHTAVVERLARVQPVLWSAVERFAAAGSRPCACPGPAGA